MSVDLKMLADLADSLEEWDQPDDATDVREAASEISQLREEVASWRRVAERLESEKADERERLAQLVRDLADTTPLTKARSALILAASLVRRGRHLTETEKLTNLVNGMAEFDPDFAASIAERAGLEIERTRFGMDFGRGEDPA